MGRCREKFIVVKIPKGPPAPAPDSALEVTSPEGIHLSVGDEPPGSPEDLQEREAAAGTIQKAFKKYQTGKASKGLPDRDTVARVGGAAATAATLGAGIAAGAVVA